jgi:multiple sugar transport system permease protein/raffinose/stachyose/melibiose transport system permease protein
VAKPGARPGWRVDIPQVLLVAVLSVGAAVSFLPFFWMVTSAFKLPQEITAYPPVWLPAHPTMDNIVNVWARLDFARYFANSLFLSVVPTVIIVFTSMLLGYVLAKIDFRGREMLFLAILATMMIPYPVTLIPRYQMMVWFHWIDTYWPLIVPSMYSSFGIFLVRQFMQSIPDELLDAARVDGASELRIFAQIVIPLSMPVVSALGIFNFLGHWDSFLWPLLMLNTQKKYPLAVALASFAGENITEYAPMMAGATISVIPLLLVFLLLQRQFIMGVTLTGLKG